MYNAMNGWVVSLFPTLSKCDFLFGLSSGIISLAQTFWKQSKIKTENQDLLVLDVISSFECIVTFIKSFIFDTLIPKLFLWDRNKIIRLSLLQQHCSNFEFNVLEKHVVVFLPHLLLFSPKLVLQLQPGSPALRWALDHHNPLHS